MVFVPLCFSILCGIGIYYLVKTMTRQLHSKENHAFPEPTTQFNLEHTNLEENRLIPVQELYRISNHNHSSNDRHLMIVLNHFTFFNPDLETRHGTQADVRNLISILAPFGFGYIVFDDLSINEVMGLNNWLEYNSDVTWNNIESILIVILSHGSENYIHAHDRAYNTSQFINKFNTDQYPLLENKTKLFFISACRGDEPQLTQSYNAAGIAVDVIPGGNRNNAVQVPLYKNVVILRSTSYERVSRRDPQNGTYFIQAIVRTFRNLQQNNLEISDMFQITNNNLIQFITENHSERQVAEMQFTLEEPYYFENYNF